MKYLCPVCGFDDLDDPPKNHMICPCCATQFGYTDVGRTLTELRQMWFDSGTAFWFKELEPSGWSAEKQLLNVVPSA